MFSMSDVIGGLEDWLETVDSVVKTVLFLDDDCVFLKAIKYKCRAHNDELVTISNVAEFRAFTHSHDRMVIDKAFIDINLPAGNGIELAKEMEFDKMSTKLYFVSEIPPSEEQKTQILDLGGEFLLKKDLVKIVIFPEEVKNGNEEH